MITAHLDLRGRSSWNVATVLKAERNQLCLAAPQLHTHAVIFNVTERADGSTRALQERAFFESQQYAAAVYQSALTYAVETAQQVSANRILVTGNSDQIAVRREALTHLSPHLRDLAIYTSDDSGLAIQQVASSANIKLTQNPKTKPRRS